jgi:uncharacterized protein YlxW (UPF0749 family)
MKHGLSLTLLLILGSTFAAAIKAEDQATKVDAAQAADKLRLQLIEMQEKEAQLQTRARQLEEALKPENIARSLAGIGSTKPEELRETRRRQISIELESVRNKLKILATSRERLESSLRAAEAEAYHQSAEGATVPVTQALKAKPGSGPRWFAMAGASIGILAAVFVFALVRKLKAS